MQPLSSPGAAAMDDPMSSPTLARTLRRKRSSANAALTSRPSHLNLRDSTLHPTLDTVVFIHLTTSSLDSGAHTQLVQALIEPNFLIDAQGRTLRLDRDAWEKARDSVEALRIVGTTSSSLAAEIPAPKPPLTPDQSPDLSLPLAPAHQASARYFDVCPPSESRSSHSTSTFLMQPRLATTASPPPASTGSPQRQITTPTELLAFVIHGVGDGTELDDAAWAKLPNQLRTLLEEADQLQKATETSTNHVVTETDVRQTILDLVRPR
ncbi:hypothetical protein OC845_005929 [Tilletia horrida]|nr:hypothetical protein OC845_005929 [Tilletia horrida]